MQIYRPQLTSMLSILHRVAGVVLAVGALLVAWWLWALADGAESYALARGFLNSWFGQLLLLLWTLCTFYHLCNGIRHLAWDAGFGFDLPSVYLSGKVVLGTAVGLTLLAWLT